MRLYTTPKGQWAGTRSEAKKLGTYVQYEVPTNKRELLFFLNNYRVKVNSSHNDFDTQNVNKVRSRQSVMFHYSHNFYGAWVTLALTQWTADSSGAFFLFHFLYSLFRCIQFRQPLLMLQISCPCLSQNLRAHP